MFAPMRPNPIMASSIRRLLVERLARIWLPYIVSHTAFVQRVHPRAAVLQVRVDGRNPRAGTDAFITHMIKPAVQGCQQPCLETVLRGKVGVASLGRTGAVPPAIPDQKRLSQACAGGDDGHGPVP